PAARDREGCGRPGAARQDRPRCLADLEDGAGPWIARAAGEESAAGPAVTLPEATDHVSAGQAAVSEDLADTLAQAEGAGSVETVGVLIRSRAARPARGRCRPDQQRAFRGHAIPDGPVHSRGGSADVQLERA